MGNKYAGLIIVPHDLRQIFLQQIIFILMILFLFLTFYTHLICFIRLYKVLHPSFLTNHYIIHYNIPFAFFNTILHA